MIWDNFVDSPYGPPPPPPDIGIIGGNSNQPAITYPAAGDQSGGVNGSNFLDTLGRTAGAFVNGLFNEQNATRIAHQVLGPRDTNADLPQASTGSPWLGPRSTAPGNGNGMPSWLLIGGGLVAVLVLLKLAK